MSAQRRATIANDLQRELGAWLEQASGYIDQSSFQFKAFFRSAEKLASADAYASSIQRAMVQHLTGDLDGARHWLLNARKWPADPHSWGTEAVILSNLGYFSHATQVLMSLGKHERPHYASMLVLCGAFSAVLDAVPGTEVAETEAGRNAVSLSSQCMMTLERLNVTEAQVRAMLDIAGEVLRNHKLFFAGEDPVVRAIDDGLLYQLRVSTAPELAAEMTDEVINRLVEKDLDAPGLAFSFISA